MKEKKKLPLVSVVVPVFNAELYIRDCLNSILQQTYYNLEILLINDGSTDNSLFYMNEYKRKDKRVHVFSQPNLGVSAAKNKGLDLANGKYIYYIDADDWIDPHLIEIGVTQLERTRSDFYQFGYVKFSGKTKIDEVCNTCSEQLEYQKLISHFYKIYMDNNLFSACNKIYRLNVLREHNIRFANQRIGEDAIFNIHLLPHISSIYIDKKSYYFYRKHDESVMNQGRNIQRLSEELEVFRELKNMLLKMNIDETYSYEYIISNIYHFVKEHKYFNNKQIYSRFFDVLSESKNFFIKFDFKVKIQYIIVCIAIWGRKS